MSGERVWTIRRDSLELWQGLVLQDMGEVDFHVFGKYWKLTSSPNTSKWVLGPPDWSSGFFKARVPSQEPSNKLIFQNIARKRTSFPGNWTTSQNRHLLIKWLPFLCFLGAQCFFLGPMGQGPHGICARGSPVHWRLLESAPF